MERGRHTWTGILLVVVALLLGGLFFAGVYLGTDRGPALPLPEPEPPRDELADVPDELRYAVLLERLLAGYEEQDGLDLLDLSRRDDAVGYLASVELARRRWDAGEDACSLYLRALSLHDSPVLRRELALYLQEEGRDLEAAEQFLEILPDDTALESLRRLVGSASLAAELVNREFYEEAVAEFEQDLIDSASHDLEMERLYLRALVGMGRYDEALPGLQSHHREEPSDPEMTWWLARCLEIAGSRDEALALYESLGAEGSYRRAIILEGWGRLEEAAAAFVSAPEPEARWRGARLWEHLGHPSRALPVYVELGREPGVLQDDAAFRAYVLLAERQDEEADEFAAYLETMPAWMARLGGEAHWETVAEPAGDYPAFLARVDAYRASGRGELAELELAIGRDRVSPADRLALGAWYLEEGDLPAAVAQGSRVLREYPSIGAYHLAYPRPFEEFVTSAAADYDLDPFLLLAVMREESRFRPAVVSWAGARGLMQIMPATGRDIAARKGIAFAVEDLFDPETNIRFGAFYLRSMMDTFHSDLDRALAAYNAGPGHVQRWQATPLGADPVGFPAAVTFVETREYITRVRNSHLTYLWLYR